MADGPLQPLSIRATTTPVPPLTLPINPTFVTVRMATPLAARITAGGIAFSGIASKRSMTATAWSTSLCRPSLPEPNVEHAPSRAAKTRKIAFMLSLIFRLNGGLSALGRSVLHSIVRHHRVGSGRPTPLPRKRATRRLLSGEEVIVRRVIDASRRPGRGLRTTNLRRHATHRIHSLYTRDLAERTFRANGLRGK